MKSNKKTIVILVSALLVLALVFGAVTILTSPGTNAGEKLVTVEVISGGETVEVYEEKTDAEFLGQLLLEAGIAEGEESEYGLYITAAAGITADEGNQEWWCITKGGEEVFTGADSTPIADGDRFELTLMVGW